MMKRIILNMSERKKAVNKYNDRRIIGDNLNRKSL